MRPFRSFLFIVLVHACTFAWAQDQSKPEVLKFRIRFCGIAADGSKDWHPAELLQAQQWISRFFETKVSNPTTTVVPVMTYDCAPYFATEYDVDDIAFDIVGKTPLSYKHRYNGKGSVVFARDGLYKVVRYDALSRVNGKKTMRWPKGDFLGAVMVQAMLNQAMPGTLLGTWDPTDIAYIVRGSIPRFGEDERVRLVRWIRGACVIRLHNAELAKKK